jgi:SpoVK/Ycf46/Vps4 family AAA+-type ATPase
MFCNYCGAQNPGDASFCSACGKPIAPQVSHSPQAVQTVQDADPWDRLALPLAIKQQLQNSCRMLRQAERYKAQDGNFTNILLSGPPGTAKTEIARTFADAAGVAFLSVALADLKSEFVGQSAQRVREVFARARAITPAIVFIDRIETATPKGNAAKADPSTGEIVIQMLQEINGARTSGQPIVVLAATDRKDEIEPAILNSFVTIEIPLRGEVAR